jgi:hypothetical protein
MRATPKEIKDMLLEVSIELNQPYNMVEDIYFYQFKFISEQMAKGQKGDYDSFENILIKHLGTFMANKKYILKLKEIDEKRKANEIDIQ